MNTKSGQVAEVTKGDRVGPGSGAQCVPVPSFSTDPYWFRNNAFKLPSITLLPNQLCVWILINASLCIKRKCMSYKQSKYILLRWEKTNPLVKLLCCNQRLITVWACVCVCMYVRECVFPGPRARVPFFSRVPFRFWANPSILPLQSYCLAGSSHRHSNSGINFPRFLRVGEAKRWFWIFSFWAF